MSEKRYIVKLTKDERKRLNEILKKGTHPAKRQLKARILLKADESRKGPKWSDAQIADAFGTYPMMAHRVRQQFVEAGIEAVLARKQREKPPIEPIFDGEKEARLIQLACSEAPPGQARWSLRLLASKVVELKIVDHASHSTVGLVLKKTFSSPTAMNNGLSRQNKTLRS